MKKKLHKISQKLYKIMGKFTYTAQLMLELFSSFISIHFLGDSEIE